MRARMLRRRGALAAALAASALPGAATRRAAAQPWPTRPVEVVVPYAAGGPTDRYARETGQRLSELWKQPVVVGNKPGGAAAIGAAAVATATPDGHTLLLGSFGIVSNRLLFDRLPYDPAALAPLCRLALGGGIFYLHPSLGVRDTAGLVAWGRANPGRLRFASSGIGSTPHIAAELFGWRAGVEITHVPYRGTAPAMADLLAGHINAMVDSPTSMRFAREGRVVPIAAATPDRLPQAPEVQTMREGGLDVVCRTFYGYFAPAATPAELQRKISEDMLAVARSQAIRDMFLQDGLEPQPEGPRDFAAFLDDQLAFWSTVVRERNIRL